VFHAGLAAREAGNLTLEEALQLVCLYAEAEPAKFERAALRWHARFVTESARSLLRAQIALGVAYAGVDDELHVFCPECAAREFGSD
jgi:hypothetical protein